MVGSHLQFKIYSFFKDWRGIQMGELMIGSGYCLNQASLFTLEVEPGVSQCRKGKTNSSQTVTIVMVIKQSLGSWSHMWSLGKVSGCGSTSLFGSRAGTHQGK